MIAEWDQKFPGRTWNVFGALNAVVPSHLMDRELFDFQNLSVTGTPNPDGDTAFDAQDFKQDPAAVRFGEDESDNAELDTTNPMPRVIPLQRVPSES